MRRPCRGGPAPSLRLRRRGRRAACGVTRPTRVARGGAGRPILVVTEVTYLLATRLGVEPEVRFLGDLASGAFMIEPVRAGDWPRIAELVAMHRDLPLGTVDASVIAAAERLDITDVATVDRRHFAVVRPRHVDAFTLLP